MSASSSSPGPHADRGWIRSAFWVGAPRAGAQARFETAINHELVPRLAALPGVQRAVALWPAHREDDPPGIACQVIAEFRRRDDLDLMLGCPERAALRAGVRELLPLFDGAVSHIDYEITEPDLQHARSEP